MAVLLEMPAVASGIRGAPAAILPRAAAKVNENAPRADRPEQVPEQGWPPR
jgi:hypothetical protein